MAEALWTEQVSQQEQISNFLLVLGPRTPKFVIYQKSQIHWNFYFYFTAFTIKFTVQSEFPSHVVRPFGLAGKGGGAKHS